MFIFIITCLIIISAIVHIRAEYSGPKYIIYSFKPLTMLLIILLVLFAGISTNIQYKFLILFGLFFSLGGDIFLMLPSDRFIEGLVSFLLAHVFYILAFSSEIGFVFTPRFLFLLLLYGIFIYVVLYPNLGKKKIPVAVYILVILLMGGQAFERWQLINTHQAIVAFIGAILFIISDSILAFNRFKKSFKTARILTLGTYFSAQWLIAMSI